MSPEGSSGAVPVLRAHGIEKRYPGTDGGPLEILKGVDLELTAGSLTAVTGSSGSGKSTLLHVLGGLDRPDAGSVEWLGRSLSGLGNKEMSRLRNKTVGFVFQFHHLLPEFSALENVCMPAWIAGLDRQEIEERAESLLRSFGLGDRFSHRPSELSGGERQRVAVARALMNRPPLLLADEPTGNLDESNSARLLDILLDLNRTHDCAMLIVTHDPAIAGRCDRIVDLTHGRLEERTTPPREGSRQAPTL